MSLTNYEEVWKTSTIEGTRAFEEKRYDDAERHFQTAIGVAGILWPDSPSLATSLSKLALVYSAQGKYKESELLHQNALEMMEKARGRMDPELAPILENYAVLLRKTHRSLEAEKLERRARVIRGSPQSERG